MNNKIKVLIVDDHQIIRDGLLQMLSNSDDINCIGDAKDGKEALEKIKNHKPDVVITDISMNGINGIELTSKITNEYPQIKVLVLTMYASEDFIFNAIRAGAKGVLSKQEANTYSIINAIHEISIGKEFFPPEISKMLIKTLIDHGKGNVSPEISNIYRLTSREKEILKLFVNGLSNFEIAKQLNISIRTVESHKNNIMQKFNFKSTVEMVKFAIRNNIVSL